MISIKDRYWKERRKAGRWMRLVKLGLVEREEGGTGEGGKEGW